MDNAKKYMKKATSAAEFGRAQGGSGGDTVGDPEGHGRPVDQYSYQAHVRNPLVLARFRLIARAYLSLK